jgi:hypothetical protein
LLHDPKLISGCACHPDRVIGFRNGSSGERRVFRKRVHAARAAAARLCGAVVSRRDSGSRRRGWRRRYPGDIRPRRSLGGWLHGSTAIIRQASGWLIQLYRRGHSPLLPHACGTASSSSCERERAIPCQREEPAPSHAEKHRGEVPRLVAGRTRSVRQRIEGRDALENRLSGINSRLPTKLMAWSSRLRSMAKSTARSTPPFHTTGASLAVPSGCGLPVACTRRLRRENSQN